VSSQLTLEADLVGKSWWSAKHGRCEVIAPSKRFPGWYRIQVRALRGHRRFQMEWPENVVRGELANPADEWVSGGDGSYFNASENRRLAALGHVPLTEPAGGAVAAAQQHRPESRQEAGTHLQRRWEMTPVAERAKAKKSAIASLSKTALRKKLLETVTISDAMWKAYRDEHGLPEREKGETREAFIRRTLG
jgi:hypothetical protein